jgi:hypothetical protein
MIFTLRTQRILSLPSNARSLEHLQPRARRGPRHPVFSSGRRKRVQSRPRFLDFAQIWAFIHPASPGHPRLSRARSGTPDERNARETTKKLSARRVAPTCRRERAVVVLIASSSAHRRLPAHRLPCAVKACRRWTCSHAARRVNARPPIYRGLPRVWPAAFHRFSPIHSPPPPGEQWQATALMMVRPTTDSAGAPCTSGRAGCCMRRATRRRPTSVRPEDGV